MVDPTYKIDEHDLSMLDELIRLNAQNNDGWKTSLIGHIKDMIYEAFNAGLEYHDDIESDN